MMKRRDAGALPRQGATGLRMNREDRYFIVTVDQS
jgi:hypothetical protein